MSESPMDRRRFFRLGFRELLKPLAEAAEPMQRALRELESLSAADNDPPKQPIPTTWLRPPGALEERRFRDVCSRCGTCVSVCPATAIKLDTSGVKGNGVPYIIPSDMPCVACDGLYCMKNCPSGALVDTPLFDIDMGTAIWHEHLCVRSQGQECMICVEKCPLGSAAIELREGKIHVIEEGCIGCGVCEHDCPTSPKSITVRPKGAAGAISRT